MSSSEVPRRRVYRVLVVDDSPLMRSLLREHVPTAGSFEVVGEAATGYEAIRQVHALKPDVVTLDLQMPDLGGLDALGYITSEALCPVVIVSARTETLADPALQAMMVGAVEIVAKPVSPAAGEMAAFRERLGQALRAAAAARLINLPRRQVLTRRRAGPATAAPARCAVVVAASTGGPRALAEVLPALPADLPAAVLVVQHMAAAFTAPLARRLGDTTALPVREAGDGELLERGVIYIAPGGVHLDLQRGSGPGVQVRLTDEPPVWGVRPAADILFAAAARSLGPATVAVVLTGMGRDGAEGCRVVREVGGVALVQDEETSVIPGMPRAAAPYADAVLPLGELADAIADAVSRRTPEAHPS